MLQKYNLFFISPNILRCFFKKSKKIPNLLKRKGILLYCKASIMASERFVFFVP